MTRWPVGILAVGFLVGTWGAWDGIARSQAPAQGGGAATDGRPPVAKVEYERWKTELSNWGRWGKDDEIGALPLHDFALIMLGVHLFDSTNLEAVAEAAASRKRWEFLLTGAPLPVRNGTGSPTNPIAAF